MDLLKMMNKSLELLTKRKIMLRKLTSMLILFIITFYAAVSLAIQYAGPIPNTSFKQGTVLARSVVLDPETGLPILVEFDASGNEVAEVNIGNTSVNDISIVASSDYFFFKNQLDQFRQNNADTLALGAELLSRNEFDQSQFILADNQTAVSQAELPQDINSVLVRGQGNRSLSLSFASGQELNQGLVLLQFTFDFTQQINVDTNSQTLVVNRQGQIVAQSSNRIGFRVGFFGDPNEPQQGRGSRINNGDFVFGPVPGVPVNVDDLIYPGGRSVTNANGQYSFQFLLPTCPIGGFSFTTDVWAELQYRNFLPTGAPRIPYYLRTPGYTFCYADIRPPSFNPLDTFSNILDPTSVLPQDRFQFSQPAIQSNLFLDVIFLGGEISLKNADGSDVAIGETTYSSFQQPAEQTTQQFYDLNSDGVFDHVEQGRILLCTRFETDEGTPLQPSETPEEVDVFLSDSSQVNNLDSALEHFTCEDTNPDAQANQGGTWQGVFFDGFQNDLLDYPDLVRVIDQEQRFEPIGVIETISEEDLRNTDVLIFRESTGQLILERRGLKQNEASYRPAVEYDEESNQVAYRILLRGENDSSLNIGGGIDRRQSFEDWATDYQLTEPFIQRQSDHPRPGEILQIVAINRATGYIGTARVPLLSPAQTAQAPLIDVEVPEITLLPPNLRIWAERNSDSNDGGDVNSTIGNEGSALTTDNTITVYTEWLDHSGLPLPAELGLDNGEQYGLTGRLSRVIGDNVLGGAGVGSDISEFAIAPGRQTQVLRVRDNSPSARAENFYVHVIGKPLEQECVAGASCPSFDVTSADENFVGRPSLITPFLTPLPDEQSTLIEFSLFRTALNEFSQNPSGDIVDVPQQPLPSYVWQYRPEYQFSQFDLDVQAISRSFTNTDGAVATEDLLNTDGIINASDTTIDIFYSLIGSEFERLAPIDGEQELVISLAGNEQLISIGNDQTITFDNLDAISQVTPEDLLNLRIYANNDASNILYEFQFEAASNISLTRTISLATFNSTETSTGSISDITDSFEILPVVVTQQSIVNIEVLDQDLRSIGSLMPNESVASGEYGVIVTYSDLLQFVENEQIYYLAVNQISNADGSESRILYTGRLQERVDSELLGQTIEHDTLLSRGSLTLRREDIELSGLGPQLNFIRSYSNELRVLNQNSPMGPGWSHNHNIFLEVLSYGDAQGVTGNNLPVWTEDLRPDESPAIFEIGELPDNDRIPQLVSVSNGGLFIFQDGAWRPSRGFHGDLVFENDRFVYTYKDGSRFVFKAASANEAESRFVVDQIIDRNDNALTYEYQNLDASQLVSSVTDASGRRLLFNYQYNDDSQSHRLVTVNSPETGIKLDFDYTNEIFDEDNTSVNATLVGFARDNFTENYSYIKETDDAIPNLSSTTDAVGNVTQYSYLESDSVPEGFLEFVGDSIALTDVVNRVDYPGGLGIGSISYGLSAGQGNRRFVTDLNGNIKTYVLNEFGNTSSIIEPLEKETKMVWTIDRGLDDILLVEQTDALGRVTTFDYDARGNIIEITDPIGTVEQTWNQNFSIMLERTDRNGNQKQYTLDDNGNILTETDEEGFVSRHTYDTNGLRRTTTHPDNGGVSNYTYDDFGNIETTRLPEGSTTEYVNDSRGNVLRMTDPNGNVSTYAYDELDRQLEITHPDNFTTEYTYDEKGNKLTEKDKLGFILTYEYDPRDRVVKATRNVDEGEQVFTYDDQSNLLTQTDWLGQVTTHTYDELHRQVTTTNRIGDTMTMAYDLVNNLLSSKDYRQLETTYTYDDGDRKITQTNPANDQMVYTYDLENNVLTQTDYENRLTRFEYDKRYLLVKRTNPIAGEAISAYDGRRNLISYQDEEERVTRYEYDRQNRQTLIIDALGFTTQTTYDDNSNVVNVNDRREFDTSYAYDAIDRPIRRTDEDGFIWRYEYDANDNKTLMVDGNGHESSYEYDLLNRVTLETTAVGGEISHTYDANNNRLTSNDAIGTVYQYEYDELDRVDVERQAVGTPELRTRTTTYDPNSNVLSVNNFRGFVTSYRYDVLNRVDLVTDPFSQTMSYTYDGVDNKLSSTDKRGFTTDYEYDNLDRLVLMTDPLDQTVATSYDEVGNVLSVRDKRGTTSNYTYDKLNRLLETTKPSTSSNVVRVVRNEYDSEGNVIAMTDANNNTWDYQYNGRNLKINTINPDQTQMLCTFDGAHNKLTNTDEIGQVTTYTYDDANRQVSATNFANERTEFAYDLNNNQTRITLPLANRTINAYDPLNRLEQITDGEDNITTYEYDGNDNLTAHVDANQNRVTYEYDELDRKTRHNQPNSLTSTYSYDPDNNMTGHIDKNGQQFTYTYDAINRQTRKDYPSVDSPFMRIDSINTDYDPNNNPVRIVETKLNALDASEITDINEMGYDLLDRQISSTQRGHAIAYTYDDQGNRLSVSSAGGNTTYTYDNRNRLSTATTENGTSTYTYTGDSKQQSVEYPNSTITSYSYDAADRITRVANENSAGNGTLVSLFTYTYDLNSNRLTQTEIQNGFSSKQEQVTAYTYDAADRLTSFQIDDQESQTSQRLDYTYDANYNRIQEVETLTSASDQETIVKDQSSEFDGNNRLTQVTNNLDDQNNTIDYVYDNNGNTLSKTDNTQSTPLVTQFIYDSRDQLSQTVRGPPESEATLGFYDYNYLGDRVRHLASERGDIEYIYDERSVLEERNLSNNNLVAHYRYSDRLISLNTDTDEQYYHYSALKTVTNLSNSTGQTQASYRSDVWGEITEQQGVSPNKHVFTGQEHDQNTGLVYFGARYYEPGSARFINEDSYLGQPSSAPSLHRYLYAHAKPSVYYDPDGHSAISGLFRGVTRGLSKSRPGITKQPLKGAGKAAITARKNTVSAKQAVGFKRSIEQSVSKGGSYLTAAVKTPANAIKLRKRLAESAKRNAGSVVRSVGSSSSKALDGVRGVARTSVSRRQGVPNRGDDLVTVYRATNDSVERALHQQSKLLTSDASREVLGPSVLSSFGPKLNNELISLAKSVGQKRFKQLVKEHGSVDALIKAQSKGGTEFAKKYQPRALFSVTRDPTVLDTFGKHHFKAEVPRSSLIKQTLKTSTESEYFLMNPTKFHKIK